MDAEEELPAGPALDRLLELEQLFVLSRDLLATIGADGRLERLNPAWDTVLGWEVDTLVGSPWHGLVHPDDVPATREVIRRMTSDARGTVVDFENRLRARDGRWLWMLWSASWDGRRCYLVAKDITGRKALEAQALHDPLTGLPNRALLVDRATQALGRLTRAGTGHVGFVVVDLDEFKTVNASHGHRVGDRLLHAVAQRLRHRIRAQDTLARLAGDQFVCLFEGPEADRLLLPRILGCFDDPYEVDGERLRVTASVGVADTADGALDPEELLRDADVALERAKTRGRARAERFDEVLRDEHRRRLALAADLRGALAAAQLRLHFQPVVDLRTDAVAGCEALLRWEHPDRGRLRPGEFLGIAEDDGQIVAIGEWVVREACRQAAQWRAAGHQLTVAVNVSALQLGRPGLVGTVRRALHDAGLPGTALCLEVTETAVLRRPEEAALALGILRDDGVRIALDDFGEGYSSVRHLRALPVDVLKVDRSFVADIHRDPEARALIRSLCSLGAALGLDVVAEGVETSEQDDVLRAVGCDFGQGWLYGMPVAPAELALAAR
ncbi:bifunctional diguanylate cyclase/phosphodiesterase [Conexibacter sp. SYSU D00693]|uniref:putative bifunctional diguanylate cyclase/phosphodiesterase n=1 Tax=Conexibacter sp. SYSU D00693 TaxID=2812560 RepID=UPI00196A1E69|nr:GGDEF and EAL domain-containing protein [Conexibacter sp. SYSU D00693]